MVPVPKNAGMSELPEWVSFCTVCGCITGRIFTGTNQRSGVDKLVSVSAGVQRPVRPQVRRVIDQLQVVRRIAMTFRVECGNQYSIHVILVCRPPTCKRCCLCLHTSSLYRNQDLFTSNLQYESETWQPCGRIIFRMRQDGCRQVSLIIGSSNLYAVDTTLSPANSTCVETPYMPNGHCRAENKPNVCFSSDQMMWWCLEVNWCTEHAL